MTLFVEEIQKDWTKRLNELSESDKTMAYDDETILLFADAGRCICAKNLVSARDYDKNCPLRHFGGAHNTKPYLGGIYGVFPQPEQPVPFARCRYFQLEFPRKKYNEKLPCRGDLGHCTYVGNLPRGVNWCNPKNCVQYVPLKIDILGASSTTEKMPECKK